MNFQNAYVSVWLSTIDFALAHCQNFLWFFFQTRKSVQYIFSQNSWNGELGTSPLSSKVKKKYICICVVRITNIFFPFLMCWCYSQFGSIYKVQTVKWTHWFAKKGLNFFSSVPIWVVSRDSEMEATAIRWQKRHKGGSGAHWEEARNYIAPAFLKPQLVGLN